MAQSTARVPLRRVTLRRRLYARECDGAAGVPPAAAAHRGRHRGAPRPRAAPGRAAGGSPRAGSDAEAGSDPVSAQAPLFASAVTASLQGSSEPSRLAQFDLGVGYRAVGLALTKLPTSVTNLESSGDRLSRLQTSASGNDSLRSATFNITTPSGHRQRAVSRTKPTPMP
jgi:hypothetical protein